MGRKLSVLPPKLPQKTTVTHKVCKGTTPRLITECSESGKRIYPIRSHRPRTLCKEILRIFFVNAHSYAYYTTQKRKFQVFFQKSRKNDLFFVFLNFLVFKRKATREKLTPLRPIKSDNAKDDERGNYHVSGNSRRSTDDIICHPEHTVDRTYSTAERGVLLNYGKCEAPYSRAGDKIVHRGKAKCRNYGVTNHKYSRKPHRKSDAAARK